MKKYQNHSAVATSTMKRKSSPIPQLVYNKDIISP